MPGYNQNQPLSNVYDPLDNENTMNRSIQNSGVRSRNALAARYRDVDFEQAMSEMCHYIKHRIPRNADRNHRYAVASRAFSPSSNIYANGLDDLATVVYYWYAAHDQSITMSTVETRCEAFITALHECIRNIAYSYTHNSTLDYLNSFFTGSTLISDHPICSIGVINKFAETFGGLHPDASTLDSFSKIKELAQGFVAEYLLRNNVTHERMVSQDFEAVLPDGVKTEIKRKINAIMKDSATVVFVDHLFAAIDSLEFTTTISSRYTGQNLSSLTHAKFYGTGDRELTLQEAQDCVRNGHASNLKIKQIKPLNRADIQNLINYANTEFSNVNNSASREPTTPRPLTPEKVAALRDIIHDIFGFPRPISASTLVGANALNTFTDVEIPRSAVFLPRVTVPNTSLFTLGRVLSQAEVNNRTTQSLSRRGLTPK